MIPTILFPQERRTKDEEEKEEVQNVSEMLLLSRSIIMIDQSIKRALLQFAYFIFFLYTSLLHYIPNVDQFYEILRRYFFVSSSSRSQPLETRKQDQLLLDQPKRNLRIPEHIALAFTNESNQLDIESISALVCWCKQLGIKYITLFDDLGRLKTRQKELNEAVEDLMNKIGYEKPLSCIKGVQILSRLEGRQKFVEDIRDLIKVEPDKIDINLVQKQIGWTSDPELLISFGNHFCLHGFPPWQLRLTEIFSIPTHRNITYKIFKDCLERYSQTTQRLGA